MTNGKAALWAIEVAEQKPLSRAVVRWRVRSPHIALIPGVAVAFVEKCELSELSPVCGRRFRQNGTIFLPTHCVLANVPSSGVRVIWPGTTWLSGGVVFSKLSKLLNQEDALSAPCLRGDSAPRRRALAGRRNAADRRNPLLRCHFTVCYTQDIMPASNDAFPVVGGRCTGRAHRCKAKQGRRGKTALTCGSYSHISTVFGRRREDKRISLVTMAGAFFIRAQRSDCRCGRFTLTLISVLLRMQHWHTGRSEASPV
jgi:hypothetical protein